MTPAELRAEAVERFRARMRDLAEAFSRIGPSPPSGMWLTWPEALELWSLVQDRHPAPEGEPPVPLTARREVLRVEWVVDNRGPAGFWVTPRALPRRNPRAYSAGNWFGPFAREEDAQAWCAGVTLQKVEEVLRG